MTTKKTVKECVEFLDEKLGKPIRHSAVVFIHDNDLAILTSIKEHLEGRVVQYSMGFGDGYRGGRLDKDREDLGISKPEAEKPVGDNQGLIDALKVFVESDDDGLRVSNIRGHLLSAIKALQSQRVDSIDMKEKPVDEELVEKIVTEIQCRILIDIKLADDLREEFRKLLTDNKPRISRGEIEKFAKLLFMGGPINHLEGKLENIFKSKGFEIEK